LQRPVDLGNRPHGGIPASVYLKFVETQVEIFVFAKQGQQETLLAPPCRDEYNWQVGKARKERVEFGLIRKLLATQNGKDSSFLQPLEQNPTLIQLPIPTITLWTNGYCWDIVSTNQLLKLLWSRELATMVGHHIPDRK